MKRLFMLAASVVVLLQPSFAQQRKSLLARLATLQTQGYMFGHQDDPFYGLTWEWERGRSDVKETCGDYPA